MTLSIVSIVEGHAETESIRVLLTRILESMQRFDVAVARPFRVKRNRVVRPGELERAVQQAVSDRADPGGVLVLLDADDDCPATLGPALLERCRGVTRLPSAVVLANKEFEGWFLGSKESLRGVRGIRQDALAPPAPEGIKGAKELLSRNMMAGRRYVAVDDQAALARRMDLEMARGRCPSFDKFLRDVDTLVSQLGGGPQLDP